MRRRYPRPRSLPPHRAGAPPRCRATGFDSTSRLRRPWSACGFPQSGTTRFPGGGRCGTSRRRPRTPQRTSYRLVAYLHVLLRHRLLPKSEVGKRPLAVPVGDEPHHLAAANMEQVRPLHLYIPDLQPARLAAPAQVHKHEHLLVVESAVLSAVGVQILKGALGFAPRLGHRTTPVQLPGVGPSAATNSMSGCAHSLEL